MNEHAVAALRRFNRFHTLFVGALGGSLHGSGFTLTEARVLYELAQRDGWLAGDLARMLGLDPAYLSRILKRFAEAGWLERTRSLEDGRAWSLCLTDAGRAMFRPLDMASCEKRRVSCKGSMRRAARGWSRCWAKPRRCSPGQGAPRLPRRQSASTAPAISAG